MAKKLIIKKHRWHEYIRNQRDDEEIAVDQVINVDQHQIGAGSTNRNVNHLQTNFQNETILNQTVHPGYEPIVNENTPYLLNGSANTSKSFENKGIIIKKCSSKYYDKFSYLTEQFKVYFKFDKSDYLQANKNLDMFFDLIISKIVKSYNSHDSIRLIIFHPCLDSYLPISFPFISVSELTSDLLSNLFSSVSQSKRKLKIDEEIVIRAEVIKYISGSGLENDQFIKEKNRSVWPICNSDNFCLLRAIIIGNNDLNKYKKVRSMLKKNNNELNKLVSFYVNKFNLPDKQLGLDYIRMFENEFDLQVTVYDVTYRQNGNTALYIGELNKRCIYLYYIKTQSGGHFNYIHSIKRFLNCSYFCDFCKKKYENRYKHKCSYVCEACRTFECENDINCTKNFCDICLTKVKSKKCLETHKKFICSKFEKCLNCMQNKGRYHVCIPEHKYCNNCRTEVNFDHKCFILKETLKDSSVKGFIFFDYESYLNEKNEHVPLLIIVHIYDLNNNLVSKHFFDSNEKFCFFLFNQKNYIAFAHNMKGYDGVFIMNYILNNPTPFTPQMKCVLVGHKFLRIEYKNVTILDSFSFLPMSLSCFSDTFNIETKKGFFPHLFSKLENLNYIGKYPHKNMYGYEYFNEDQQKRFDLWYKTVSSGVFDYKKDLYDYCDADVHLLATGILKFREIILKSVQIEPFFNCSTIACLAHLIYRQKFMPIDKIGVIPETGYNPKENTSRKAIIWLKYIELINKVTLITTSSGGEYKIGNYKVDGYDPVTNTAYEFLGCVFHACKNCYSLNTFNTYLQKYNYQINERDMQRRNYLRTKVNLVEIKECEWEKLIKDDISVKYFVEKTKIKPPINAREALFGGRTNAFKLYHKVKNNEKIKYIDINSLYPSVQFYCEYPIDHPEILTNNFTAIENYFGLAKIDILPPQDLLIPVLPLKINGKLVFTLCFTCASEHIEQCNHKEVDRQLHGTWCTNEIMIAVKHGYQIKGIYEIWNFKNRAVLKETENGIFNEYIKTFMKIKQESSGFPDDVLTDEDKNNYIKDYYSKQGVKLDIGQIKKNKGMRAVAKLLLNSLWGRFGMQTNKMKTKLFSESAD